MKRRLKYGLIGLALLLAGSLTGLGLNSLGCKNNEQKLKKWLAAAETYNSQGWHEEAFDNLDSLQFVTAIERDKLINHLLLQSYYVKLSELDSKAHKMRGDILTKEAKQNPDSLERNKLLDAALTSYDRAIATYCGNLSGYNPIPEACEKEAEIYELLGDTTMARKLRSPPKNR
jgi:hypothetical protein